MNVHFRRKGGWSAHWSSVLGGLGAGSAAMYLLDPDRGAQRRSALWDSAHHNVRKGRRFLQAAASDLANRARGIRAFAQRPQGPVSDDVLVARVRSELGHFLSHAHALEVSAHDGRITVRGPILAAEADSALRLIGAMEGVSGVDSELDVYEDASHQPALQGAGKALGPRSYLWTPGIRLLAGASGAAFGLWGAMRGGWLGYAAAGAGALALTRSILNEPLGSLVGIGEAGHLRIQETVEVNVPIESVFGFWSDFENFHSFMQHVRAVRVLDDHHTHWVVAGPAGTEVEWDAESHMVPYESISWCTTPESPVHHAGRVRFTPTGETSTQVNVQMTWKPAGGLAGRAIASLFGMDPQRAISEDLKRFKNILEADEAPQRAYRVQVPG